MTKFYVGGSLFTDKQIAQRISEEEQLKQLSNAEIYNPITNDEINDKTQKPTANDIFVQDTVRVLASDVILADLDDDDLGLAMELGIAFASNYFRNRIIERLNSDSPIQALHGLLEEVPQKMIYATCSDIRQDTTDEFGIYKSWSLNQYYVGGIEAMGEIHRHFDSVMNSLLEREYAQILIKENKEVEGQLEMSDCEEEK